MIFVPKTLNLWDSFLKPRVDFIFYIMFEFQSDKFIKEIVKNNYKLTR